MRLIFPAVALLLLTACSIKSNREDYQYPALSDPKNAPWPELAVTADLVAAGQTVHQSASDNQTAADRLAARARALRARAKRLQQEAAN